MPPARHLLLVKHSQPALEPGVPAAQWQRLGLPSFVVLSLPDLGLITTVAQVGK